MYRPPSRLHTAAQTCSERCPYILRCEAVGVLEGGLADGRSALLLEHCPTGLASYLRDHGAVPEGQAARWLKQVRASTAAWYVCTGTALQRSFWCRSTR
jgi:hypothetical protein